MTDIRRFISGSDIRGESLPPDAPLSPLLAQRLGEAFAAFLRRRTGKANPVTAIGRDPRLSGEALLDACAEGMRSAGARVIDTGLCTTPAMFMSLCVPGWAEDGSVMVTASHLPPEKNGFKFFLPEGGVSVEDLEEIIRLAESDDAFSAAGGSVRKADFLPVYRELLQRKIRQELGTDDPRPLTGLHVAVDAGNGSGGFYAAFLEEMGARTDGSRYLEPDGHFPNHIPNPEDPAAMEAISGAVRGAFADIGVIFDADCDRAAIVDRDGRAINRNRLIALVSAMLLNRKSGLTVVTDSVTSTGLARFIAERGGIHYRYRRGYHHVIEEARRLNEAGVDCPLAIETSGHAALRENHFLDDGMYLVTLLICEAMKMKRQGKQLSTLIAGLKEPLESAEIRISITDPQFREKGKEVIERVMRKASCDPAWKIAPDNREGVRILFDLNGETDSAWFLLRLSVHDPVLPLNLESDAAGGTLIMAGKLLSVLQGADGIDPAPLEKYIHQQERK